MKNLLSFSAVLKWVCLVMLSVWRRRCIVVSWKNLAVGDRLGGGHTHTRGGSWAILLYMEDLVHCIMSPHLQRSFSVCSGDCCCNQIL